MPSIARGSNIYHCSQATFQISNNCAGGICSAPHSSSSENTAMMGSASTAMDLGGVMTQNAQDDVNINDYDNGSAQEPPPSSTDTAPTPSSKCKYSALMTPSMTSFVTSNSAARSSSKRSCASEVTAMGGLVGEFVKFNHNYDKSVMTSKAHLEREMAIPPALPEPSAQKMEAKHCVVHLERNLDPQAKIALFDIFQGDMQLADQYLIAAKDDVLQEAWVKRQLQASGHLME
jgi:hypothetical protein